jgi:hypothetical protein
MKKMRGMLSLASVPVMGALLAVPLSGLLAGSASADSTCYTGCTTATTGITASSGTVSASAGDSPSTDSGSSGTSALAFTGADIEELAVVGLVATGVGVVLVRGSRRRHA